MADKKNLTQTPDVMFQEALALHQGGDFAQAETLYRHILQVAPNHADSWHFLGVMAYQLGNHDVAVELINKALSLHPSVSMYANLALVLQAQGNLEQLIDNYQQALLLENNATLHYNLANILAQQGNLPAAVEHYQAAVALNPKEVEFHNSLGNTFVGLKSTEAAIACYQKVLELQPAYGQVHNNLANLLKEQGKLDEAVASYHQALALMPEYGRGYHNLAVALYEQGKISQAINYYKKSISLEPHHESYFNLGCLLQGQKKWDEAIDCFQQAIALKSDFFNAYQNLGTVLRLQKKLDQAVACYEKLMTLNPEHPSVYGDLATVFYEKNDCPKAAEYYQKALVLNPDNANHHYHFSKSLIKQGYFEEALQECQKAIALNPDCLEFHNALAIILQNEGKYLAAIAVVRQALAYNLYHAHLNFNLGLALLSCGNYEEGWQHAEYRYDAAIKEYQFVPPKVLFPQWQGEPIAGKSILIWYEQGFGDEIQFCRYVTVLKKMGAKQVTLACKKPLKPLFETLQGLDKLLVDGEDDDIPPHDYWSLVLSLPLHCKTTLQNMPVSDYYLRATPVRVEYWKNKLPQAKMRIGLVWKGSAGHGNDANRSLSHLNKLLPLWDVADCTFVSLQKGQGEDEVLALPKHCPMTHLGSDINDFADTAAIISQLDLVICVDTSIAHLAGALGKPVWVLLPFIADWRWIINREDNPWYPKLRLFRQTQRGHWDEVIERMKKRLQSVVAGESLLIWPVAKVGMTESQKAQLLKSSQYSHRTTLALAKQTFNFKDAYPFEEVKAVFMANKSATALSQRFALPQYRYAELFEDGIYAIPTNPMYYASSKLKITAQHGKPSMSFSPIVNSYVNAGNDFLMRGDWDKANENYSMALAFDCKCAEAQNGLGVAFHEQGNLHQAIEHYQQALLLKPDYVQVHFNLGRAFDGLQNFETAIEHYRQALVFDPDYADARKNLNTVLKFRQPSL